MTVFFSQLINGLSLGSIYALIALGYSKMCIRDSYMADMPKIFFTFWRFGSILVAAFSLFSHL